MAVILSSAARTLLDSAQLGHVVTRNRDRTPQVSCVWVGLDDGEVVFASLGEWQKLRNLEADPTIVVSVEAPPLPGMHLQEYLVIYGQARVEAGGAPTLLQELAHTYLGPDVKFPALDDPPPGFVVRIAIEKVSGNGHWTA